MAIVAIVSVSNCSRIPENNDPVIGIWSRMDVNEVDETSRESVRQEWIFNDVYLGRYHRYENNTLVVKTDFNWETNDGIYTINYPGTEMPSHTVTRKDHEAGEVLADTQDNILAFRE
ncbi:MAG: hypothetical protein HKP60_08140 [Eudoraea sp.]|nr:hypothetical protein [Eudoraea sp.]NNJ40822.1 hypothetical protein [Eudoraea sp.]